MAYLDNMFDVSSLLEDSEMKMAALERVELLEEQLFEVSSFSVANGTFGLGNECHSNKTII